MVAVIHNLYTSIQSSYTEHGVYKHVNPNQIRVVAVYIYPELKTLKKYSATVLRTRVLTIIPGVKRVF
jgi:hypothetical protein